LLKNAGIEFVVYPADIPEVPLPGESPQAFAERMALAKAREVRASGCDGAILAADTVVAVETEILGKPADATDAARMLRRLRGRTHEVVTAICLLGEEFEDERSESTAVHLNPMSESDIAEYLLSGEPLDKAGAYAIQGRASRWISKIDGDYSNVVGLPVALVWRMLREHKVI